MRKPKDYDGYNYITKDGDYVMAGKLMCFEEIPRLIKWLESVREYNEFNAKKKVKKVKNGN